MPLFALSGGDLTNYLIFPAAIAAGAAVLNVLSSRREAKTKSEADAKKTLDIAAEEARQKVLDEANAQKSADRDHEKRLTALEDFVSGKEATRFEKRTPGFEERFDGLESKVDTQSGLLAKLQEGVTQLLADRGHA